MRVTLVDQQVLSRDPETLSGVESAHERRIDPDNVGVEIVYADGGMERWDTWSLAGAEGGPFRATVTHPQSSYGHEALNGLEALRETERDGVPSVRGRTAMGRIVETHGYMRSASVQMGLGI
jgi:hypothetical protein